LILVPCRPGSFQLVEFQLLDSELVDSELVDFQVVDSELVDSQLVDSQPVEEGWKLQLDDNEPDKPDKQPILADQIVTPIRASSYRKSHAGSNIE
jgi:hypothetical protein